MRPLSLAVVIALSGCATVTPPPAPPSLGVDLVSRSAWGALPPQGAMPAHTPSGLTIHHTATPQRHDADPRATMRSLQHFSVSSDTLDDGEPKLPWADVPYHFYIAPDGTTLEGRDPRVQGDSNTDYDLDGQIQIAVEGNFMEEVPTPAQMASLLALSQALARRYRIEPEAVGGHRDRATGQTTCPGDALAVELDAVRDAVRRGSGG